jgi:hypothetical protein
MLLGEKILDRFVKCGESAALDLLVKEMYTAKEIYFNGKLVTDWPRDLQTEDFPLVVYFHDGSFIKIAATFTSNVVAKWTWGEYITPSKMD